MAKKKKTKPVCAKCGNPGEFTWVHGGNTYLFCRGCHAILSSHESNNLIEKFLDGTLSFTKVQKSMIEARQDRNAGKRLWKKPD